MVKTHIDADGIAVLTFDQDGHSTNVINQATMTAFNDAFQAAVANAEVKGIIITSAKKDFIAGADLEMVVNMTDPQEVFALTKSLTEGFRKIETCGKPVVAAINGSALGGGLELTLACHYRVAVNDGAIQLGLPEVMIGLLPGAGGTQRLPRLIGIQKALQHILQGTRMRPDKALSEGIIHELVATKEDLIPAAKKAILEKGLKVQPWDQKGFKIPGGGVQSPDGAQTFTAGIALLRKQTYGNYPGAWYAMSAVYEGLQLPIDRALIVEARYFTKAHSTKEAKHMIRTLFFHKNEADKGAARPKNIGEIPLKKVGVLGAGMMGAGIAYVSAEAGLETVLKDISIENAEKGKDYSRKILGEKLSKKRLTQEQHDAKLALITPTADPAAVAGSDLIIEAVFEDRDLKARVTAESEAVIAESAVFASNTSTLPITGLAEASKRPANFIGLHFFSPVEKMPLVEIIMGKETSDHALAMAVDYVKKIKKTPIVVNDSRGFYTSRVFATYVNEAFYLLDEGVAPALIENAGKAAGMPVAPLALADEVSLELMKHIADQTIEDLGDEALNHPVKGPALKLTVKIGKTFVDELGRKGKKVGVGFYDYPQGGKKQLWGELGKYFPAKDHGLDLETLKQRMLLVQSVDAVRCLEEGVLRNPQDGDIGSIFGWGFAPYTGGAISYVEYVGLDAFIARCHDFAARFGPRFAAPQLLLDMQKAGKTSFFSK